MKVSIVTVCFDRDDHLRDGIKWFEAWLQGSIAPGLTIERVVVTDSQVLVGDMSTGQIAYKIMHRHAVEGPFNKARELNLGAGAASGDYLIFVDVDLLPVFNYGLLLDCKVLLSSVVFSGYRLDTKIHCLEDLRTSDASQFNVCPEDGGTALKKYLLAGHRFGVCPVILRSIFMDIGGFDEEYTGWGGEDQDLFERAVELQGPLVRAPDYLWLHMSHETSKRGWNDADLTLKNRKRYSVGESRRKLLKKYSLLPWENFDC